jgi:hypothetical protein
VTTKPSSSTNEEYVQGLNLTSASDEHPTDTMHLPLTKRKETCQESGGLPHLPTSTRSARQSRPPRPRFHTRACPPLRCPPCRWRTGSLPDPPARIACFGLILSESRSTLDGKKPTRREKIVPPGIDGCCWNGRSEDGMSLEAARRMNRQRKFR